MKIWMYLELSITAFGCAIGYFFGSTSDGLLYALLAISVADYISGVIKAVIMKTLSSAVGFKGIIRKFVMFMVVGVANIIDMHVIIMVTSTGTDGNIVRDAVILFFIANECISILENAVLMGVPVPEQLKTLLLQLRQRSDKTMGFEANKIDGGKSDINSNSKKPKGE